MGIKECDRYFVIFVIFSVIQFSVSYNFEYNHLEPRLPGLIRPSTPLDLKYVLLWTNETEPIRSNLREGNIPFRNRKCSYTNCYVTSNRELLKDVADFDVLLFNGRELPDNASFLPQSRSPHQKYIYANMESSSNFPVCNQIYNNYFNWTWTYKLNSDEIYGYVSIRDKEGKVIGPKVEMHWEKVEAMMPINDTLKEKLNTKKIAAAWFVSHCDAPSGRDLIAKQLQNELEQYGMQVDIFGRCGTKKCPRGNRTEKMECLRLVETDYYFYLAFENTFADDYVTEKLLNGLNHYAVPVVYGGANYTRFMPEGIYLTAQQSRIRELAKEMVDIINDKQKYYEFFKWHNHYSYHDLRGSPDTDAYCKLCELINNDEHYSRTSVYEDFSQWWSPQHECL